MESPRSQWPIGFTSGGRDSRMSASRRSASSAMDARPAGGGAPDAHHSVAPSQPIPPEPPVETVARTRQIVDRTRQVVEQSTHPRSAAGFAPPIVTPSRGATSFAQPPSPMDMTGVRRCLRGAGRRSDRPQTSRAHHPVRDDDPPLLGLRGTEHQLRVEVRSHWRCSMRLSAPTRCAAVAGWRLPPHERRPGGVRSGRGHGPPRMQRPRRRLAATVAPLR